MSQALEESSILESARHAIDTNAWREAFDLLKQAASAEPLGPEDLERLADAAWWTGQLEESINARQQAYAGYLKRSQPRQAANAAISLASDYMGKLSESMAMGWVSSAERLLENESESPEHGRLLNLKAFLAFYSGQYETTLEYADKVLEIGTRFADRDLQAFGLLFRGRVLVAHGEVEKGLALLDEATVAAVSGELGPQTTGMIYCMAITSTSSLRDYRRAGEWTEAAKRWCDRQSISGFPGHCRVLRAEIMQLRGSWAEAEKDVKLAVNELKDFNLILAGEAFCELGEIRLRMGDLRAAEDAFHQAEELGMDPQPGMSLLRLAEGDLASAAGGVKRALAEEVRGQLHRFPLLHAQAEIALASGDLGLAETATAELDEIAEVYGTAALRAAAAGIQGALEIARDEPAGAVDTLRRTLRLWKEANVPYESARTRVLLSEAYTKLGEPDSALLELRTAGAAFQRLGATLDLRKTHALLGGETGTRPKPASRVTVTFMFTDIVKSTNLVEAIGDEAWSQLLDWHDKTLRSLFLANGGEEVKQVGDGFFIAFDQSEDAINCAIAVQRTLAEHRRAHGFAPRVRIGLHCGDATRKGSDFEGGQVHVAARVAGLASGDEILISKTSCTASKRDFSGAETRTVSLKGIEKPVEIVTLDWR
ncbi:MAG: adenylate/guanylate cyclase domain-containing protein [Actinomycetota bacterium]